MEFSNKSKVTANKSKEKKEVTIHCIHDTRRIDRHELLMKEIQDHNLDVQIWDACIDSPKAKVNINLCHKKLVQFAKDNSMPEILIAEDDFHLVHPMAFSYFLNKKPLDFDLYLAAVIWGSIGTDNTIQDYAGNQMYIINQRYYDTFLSSDPNRDIDRAQARRGRFIVCNPLAVTQHETFSDNAKRVHHHIKLYRDKIIYNGTNG